MTKEGDPDSDGGGVDNTRVCTPPTPGIGRDFAGKPAPVVKFFWLKKPSPAIRDQAIEKLAEMGKFIFNQKVERKACDSMIPLPGRTMGGFLSPLQECSA